ncbi:MAG: hypothetical protein ACI4J1_06075 [Ruminiclostridium sp.]
MKQIDLLLKTSAEIDSGKRFTREECSEIVHTFLNNMNESRVVSGKNRDVFPKFFIPNSEGKKKMKHIIGASPNSVALAENSYELEIMRILGILGRPSGFIDDMLKMTRDRIKNTCFGNFCYKGECFETSVVVLRFYNTVYPCENEIRREFVKGILEHFDDRRRPRNFQKYCRKVFSELPCEVRRTN